jgi:hypothetical protein
MEAFGAGIDSVLSDVDNVGPLVGWIGGSSWVREGRSVGVVHRERAGATLLQDELHVVRCVGRVVWCDVIIPKSTQPVAGAEAAQRVGKYLVSQVLHRRSPWLGLILDVRQGPSVFGPITRDVCVNLFTNAEQARKPFAVVTVASRPLHAQYSELAAVHAPQYSLVTESLEQAMDWMTRSR